MPVNLMKSTLYPDAGFQYYENFVPRALAFLPN